MAHEKKTLWVGDVMSWMDEAYLVNLFQQAGGVTGAKVIRDRTTNQPVGYGFVEFESHEKAAKVLQLFSTSVNPATNKPFKLNWGVYGGTGITGGGMSGNSNVGYTKPQNREGGGPPGDGPGMGDSRGGHDRYDRNDRHDRHDRQDRPPRSYDSGRGPRIDAMAILKRDSSPVQVYVGDLDITVDNEALLNHFMARCNGAQSSRIIVDMSTQLSKGYGFVNFSNREDAEDAMKKMHGSYLRGKPIKVKESFSRTNPNTSGSSGPGAVKKEKMTPLQIQRMYQSGQNQSYRGGGGYGQGGNPNFAAQQQQINMQQYQYMIALQQQQILQQQQLLMQQQQQAKKDADKAEADKEKPVQTTTQVPAQLPPNAAPVLTLAQIKLQQQQHIQTLMYYQQLATQNAAYLPYFQQQQAAYQIFVQTYAKQLAAPPVAPLTPTPIIPGQIPPTQLGVNPNMMMGMGVNPAVAMKTQAYLANQQNMLRKRDPQNQQAFIKSQKKLKNGRESGEKFELDDCPKITTMMFMDEFNINVRQTDTFLTDFGSKYSTEWSVSEDKQN